MKDTVLLEISSHASVFFNRLTRVVNLSFTTFAPVFINLLLCKHRQAFKRLTPWNIFRSFYRRLFCVVRHIWLLSTRASLSCFRACGCDECGKGLLASFLPLFSSATRTSACCLESANLAPLNFTISLGVEFISSRQFTIADKHSRSKYSSNPRSARIFLVFVWWSDSTWVFLALPFAPHQLSSCLFS